jgi:hypothetical protein
MKVKKSCTTSPELALVICPKQVSSVNVRSSNRVSDVSQKSIATTNGDHTSSNQTSLREGPLQYEITDGSTVGDGVSSMANYTDLWSTAYREAVDRFGKDIDVATSWYQTQILRLHRVALNKTPIWASH